VVPRSAGPGQTAYSQHHLLDERPDSFVRLFKSQIPTATTNDRRMLMLDPDTVSRARPLARKHAAAVTSIMENTLVAEQYLTMKADAQKLLEGKTVSGFVALECFNRSSEGWTYQAVILWDTDQGPKLMNLIKDPNTGEWDVSIQSAAMNVSHLANLLRKSPAVCTVHSPRARRMSWGNVVCLTIHDGNSCRIAFSPDVPLFGQEGILFSTWNPPEWSILLQANDLLAELPLE